VFFRKERGGGGGGPPFDSAQQTFRERWPRVPRVHRVYGWRSAATCVRSTAPGQPVSSPNAFTGEVQASFGLLGSFIPGRSNFLAAGFFPQQGIPVVLGRARVAFFPLQDQYAAYAYDPNHRRPLVDTSRRTALYVATKKALFLDEPRDVIFDPGLVEFHSRRARAFR